MLVDLLLGTAIGASIVSLIVILPQLSTWLPLVRGLEGCLWASTQFAEAQMLS